MSMKKGFKHSEETKLKIGLFQRGKPNKTAFKNRDKHPRWKGGKIIRNGYIAVLLPNHPFAMSTGYIREHRIVLEKYIKRYLSRIEQVHHINKNKSDNRIENLMLFKNISSHRRFENSGNIRQEEIIFDGRKLK